MRWFWRREPRLDEAERCRTRAHDDLVKVKRQRTQVDSALQGAHAAVMNLDAFAAEVDQAFRLKGRRT